jgi:hypothetical protein
MTTMVGNEYGKKRRPPQDCTRVLPHCGIQVMADTYSRVTSRMQRDATAAFDATRFGER